MAYRIIFSKEAAADWHHWKQSGNQQVIRKITELLKDMAEHPYIGIGKPEALRYELAGCWSRRINGEHRIVYRVEEQTIEVCILSMRYHYRK
ncbi:MAG: Txe/YoeB family addiction module toxin [Rikenellaceae bacterium]|nr:Txe/YoeB family addiction module toxin [Rikenellaceae bacterium]